MDIRIILEIIAFILRLILEGKTKSEAEKAASIHFDLPLSKIRSVTKDSIF